MLVLTCLLLHSRLGTHINARNPDMRQCQKKRWMATTELVWRGYGRRAACTACSLEVGRTDGRTDAQLCARHFDQFSTFATSRPTTAKVPVGHVHPAATPASGPSFPVRRHDDVVAYDRRDQVARVHNSHAIRYVAARYDVGVGLP